ncbi:MAG: sigma 54-dependent Fis family transcriptional regulator [Deltaproteobacteria bacterium]|nr:sigma 54-dependent Fis family transcriptional regulator [Deltaproteobacteria bacterium]
MEGVTLPRPVEGLPVQSLKVEVVDGPDRGAAFEAEGDHVDIGTAEGNDLHLTDPTVSRYHVELTRCPEGVRVQDLGSTNGTRAGCVRIASGIVPPDTEIAIGQTRLKILDGRRITLELHGSTTLAGLRGQTAAIRRLMARVCKAAESQVPVLIVGESGTGKELVARSLHEAGPRGNGPFVTVDCASLQPTLVASELFGHERGAFTGADRQRIGALELAQGGTIFLDEIGELPPALQPVLLGALERRRFKRLGGRDEVSVDVRVVSATNRDLRAEVNSGAFRLDLFYRIAVVVLQIPPLRERVEDIPLLVEHFLQESSYEGPASQIMTPAAMASLVAHRWPGNVRELRNLVEAAVAMGESPVPAYVVGPPVSAAAGTPASGQVAWPDGLEGLSYRDARDRVLRQFEERYLRALVSRHRWNVSRAAREAKMDRSHLRDLLRRHGLAE